MSTQTVKSGDIVLHGYCSPKYERLRHAVRRRLLPIADAPQKAAA